MAVLVTAAALLLLCCQHAHAFDMPGGGIPGMGGEKKCAPFRCSSGHGAVPRRPLRLTSQGCHGFGMSMYSGMGGGGDDAKSGLKPCCDLLHACYGVCGSPKARCDRNFKKCSKEACAAAATDGVERLVPLGFAAAADQAHAAALGVRAARPREGRPDAALADTRRRERIRADKQ